MLVENPPNYESLIQNLSKENTSNREFYVRNHFSVPKISLSDWKLEVSFEPSKTKKFFSYDQIRSLPTLTVSATLECAGNGRINFPRKAPGEVAWGNCAVGNAQWRGVPVSEIIRAAGINESEIERVAEFIFVGADGSIDEKVRLESPAKFVRALHPDKAMDPAVIVALDMNGAPLLLDHGFPARLLVPGWYAMASVKWLKQIILRGGGSEKFSGHFNGVKYVYETKHNGRWMREAITSLRVKSLIVSPSEGSTIQGGNSVPITGKAWSGAGSVVNVEVNCGCGWHNATLGTPNGEYAWRSWNYAWTPESKGSVTLRVRATDEKGNVQSDRGEDNRYLYGYNGIHRVCVTIV